MCVYQCKVFMYLFVWVREISIHCRNVKYKPVSKVKASREAEIQNYHTYLKFQPEYIRCT